MQVKGVVTARILRNYLKHFKTFFQQTIVFINRMNEPNSICAFFTAHSFNNALDFIYSYTNDVTNLRKIFVGSITQPTISQPNKSKRIKEDKAYERQSVL